VSSGEYLRSIALRASVSAPTGSPVSNSALASRNRASPSLGAPSMAFLSWTTAALYSDFARYDLADAMNDDGSLRLHAATPTTTASANRARATRDSERIVVVPSE